MDQLPGNSHRQRREQEAPKPVERIVQGQVTVRKKSFAKRFVDTMFAGRADVVGASVFWDVLLPAVKNTMVDMNNSYVERLVFGEGSVRGRASSLQHLAQGIGAYAQVNSQQVAYNRAGNPLPGQTVAPGMSPLGRARHNVKEIVIPTRVEAEAVLDQLFARIQEYNAVTVADLYELCGITVNFTDDKHGWTDIRGAGVLAIRNGFVLDLPPTEALD